MLPYFAPYLIKIWGPFRLFDSHLTLICLGAGLAALLSFLLLPRCWKFLPRDQGKPFVKNSEEAKGKPTGAGVLFSVICLGCLCFVLPPSWQLWSLAGCLMLSMISGFWDDASEIHWSELRKGCWDGVISILAAWIVAKGEDVVIWLPVIKGTEAGYGFLIPFWIYLPCATLLLWSSINVVNCSDGVDGLVGSLSLFGICGLGVFLYGVTGHTKLSEYLLIPHNPDGALWGILLFTVAGGLAGYLWYNATPSAVLMGDAGSRFIGLLLGLGVLASGNPFLYLAVGPILLLDGGLGMFKLVLLRTLKKLHYDVRPPLRNIVNPSNPANYASDEEAARQLKIVQLVHRLRCPVHDHCRKNLNWSITQVVIRFMLIQAIVMPMILIFIIKLR